MSSHHWLLPAGPWSGSKAPFPGEVVWLFCTGPIVKVTLENPARPRDNSPVIAAMEWLDGRQAGSHGDHRKRPQAVDLWPVGGFRNGGLGVARTG